MAALQPPSTPGWPTVFAEGLQGQQDIFFVAVELAPTAMLITDPNLPDHPIVFANAAALAMSGYTREELTGRNCRLLQGPETDPGSVAELREAIARKTGATVEILNYRKDGSAFWNAVSVAPVFAADGRLLYFFGSLQDVSRRRDAEEGLLQAQKAEAAAQLTGGLAHDFTNLLTVTLAGIEAALAEGGNERQKAQLGRALEATRRAEGLAQQLLALVRRQHLRPRPTNLSLMVESRRDLLQHTMGPDISIETRLSPKLRTAAIDPVQLQAALLNVLQNAREAMPEGGKLTIETRNEEIGRSQAVDFSGPAGGSYVVLAIRDTGAGMPPEVLSRATEPFFSTKESEGSGLSAVYGFMRQSRGQLLIESEPGRGTLVQMLFPVSDGGHRTAAMRADREVRGGSETILVVEDNPEVMEVALSVLGEFGYRLLSAETGRDALAMLEAGEPIDMLFTDIVMPGGVNGVMLANEARKRVPGLKVLLTSGWADKALEQESDRGGYELIGKPYRPLDLARRIRMILDRPGGS